MAKNSSKTQSGSKKTFEHRDGSGTLFYDAPGVPTLSGTIKYGKNHDVTGEPKIDKNQVDYTLIKGNGVIGGLYINSYKEQEKHPDLTGPIEIDGQKLRISAWKKEIKSGQNEGQEYLSVAISEAKSRDS